MALKSAVPDCTLVVGEHGMVLSSGTRLGPYEIVGPIGAGSMGEVYRARDTRLERMVAVKVLPKEFARDATRRERFEREAVAASSLNHPHICALYDVGVQDETPYLVMECVEGETLAARLQHGRLNVPEAILLASQIADALDAAHRHGIVHRDLKPGNIMLNRGGAKLLDFGLARMGHVAKKAVVGSTITMGVTDAGTVLGTPQYMSPEQVEGRDADARSDIFALGGVLYEMLSGRKAFTGESPASVMASILKTEPETVEAIPQSLERVIRICLAKDPADRWQSARDVCHALDAVRDASPSAVRPSRFTRLGLAVGAAGLIAVAAAGWMALRRAPVRPSSVRFTVAPPEGTHLNMTMRISPNGELLLFGVTDKDGRSSLWLRALQAANPQMIQGTEGATSGFWSHDSRSIAFTAHGSLKRLDLAGGSITTLCTGCSVMSGTWNRDSVILLGAGALGQPIQRIPAQGGPPIAVTHVDTSRDEIAHSGPLFAADQKHFTYFVLRGNRKIKVRMGSIEDTATHPTLPVEAYPIVITAAGVMLFPRDRTILSRPFDVGRATLSGEAVLMAEPVASAGFPWMYPFTMSENGTMAWLTGANQDLTQLTWYGPGGKRLDTLGEPGDYSNPALSPDGKGVLVGRRGQPNAKRALFYIDLEQNSMRQVTNDAADNTNPVWSPDATRVAWSADPKGSRDIFTGKWEGSLKGELLLASALDKSVEQWTSDGAYLIFNQQNKATDEWTLWALPVKEGVPRVPMLLAPQTEGPRMGRVSPDGRYLAYTSYPGGGPEVIVKRFPPSPDGWRLRVGAGVEPQWSADGSHLYWVEDDTVMVAPVTPSNGRITLGGPAVAVKAGLPGIRRNRVAIAKDGRLLVNALLDQAPKNTITVVTNSEVAKPR